MYDSHVLVAATIVLGATIAGLTLLTSCTNGILAAFALIRGKRQGGSKGSIPSLHCSLLSVRQGFEGRSRVLASPLSVCPIVVQGWARAPLPSYVHNSHS